MTELPNISQIMNSHFHINSVYTTPDGFGGEITYTEVNLDDNPKSDIRFVNYHNQSVPLSSSDYLRMDYNYGNVDKVEVLSPYITISEPNLTITALLYDNKLLKDEFGIEMSPSKLDMKDLQVQWKGDKHNLGDFLSPYIRFDHYYRDFGRHQDGYDGIHANFNEDPIISEVLPYNDGSWFTSNDYTSSSHVKPTSFDYNRMSITDLVDILKNEVGQQELPQTPTY